MPPIWFHEFMLSGWQFLLISLEQKTRLMFLLGCVRLKSPNSGTHWPKRQYGYASRFVGPKIDGWDTQLPISCFFFGFPNFALFAFKFVNVLLHKVFVHIYNSLQFWIYIYIYVDTWWLCLGWFFGTLVLCWFTWAGCCCGSRNKPFTMKTLRVAMVALRTTSNVLLDSIQKDTSAF